MAKMKDCPPGTEFVFKLPNGTVIGKAKNKYEFCEIVKGAPIASLAYHARGGHFTPWLELIGEKKAADTVKGIRIEESTLRMELLRQLR